LKVKVCFIGALSWLAGKDEVSLELKEGSDVLTALRELCERCPHLSQALFDADTGDPRTNFLVLLNGRDIDVLGGLSAVLKDGDVLTLIPLMRL